MPQLVQGHMRFTDDDFLYGDFHEKTMKLYKNESPSKLTELLKIESQQLVLMKDREVNELFNTEKNIKHALSHSLTLISAIAEREGYTLTDLMRM
jgi:hypothetical protein